MAAATSKSIGKHSKYGLESPRMLRQTRQKHLACTTQWGARFASQNMHQTVAGTRVALQSTCETGVGARCSKAETRVTRNMCMRRWRERGDREKERRCCETPKTLHTKNPESARLHTKEPQEATCRHLKRFD